MNNNSEQSAKPAEPLRVGWVAGGETFFRFGVVLRALAVGLMEETVQLTVLRPGPDDSDLKEVPTPPVEVINYAPRRWWRSSGARRDRLGQLVKKRKISLLHSLDCGAWRLTRELADETGLNYLLSIYRRTPPGHLRELRSGGAAVAVASPELRKRLMDKGHLKEDRVFLVRPGLHKVRGATCFDEQSYGDIALVAWACPSADFDDYKTVLNAYAEIHNRGYKCAYFLIDGGRFERKLRRLADELGLGGEVTFVSPKPARQLRDIFKAADVCIFPDAARTTDIEPLMSMSAGTCVLAARQEPLAEYFIDGQTALMFATGDATDLTAKLAGLLDNPSAARAIAHGALDYIANNHSPSQMVSDVADIYRKLTQ